MGTPSNHPLSVPPVTKYVSTSRFFAVADAFGLGILICILFASILIISDYSSHRAKKLKTIPDMKRRRTIESFFNELFPFEVCRSTSQLKALQHFLVDEHIFGCFHTTQLLFPRWLHFASRAVALLFVNTIMIAFFYPDTSCLSISSYHECDNVRAFSIVEIKSAWRICEWKADSGGCTYNTAGLTDPGFLLLSAVLIFLTASPLLAILHVIVERIHQMIVHSMSYGTHSTSFSYEEDEFYHPEPATLKQIILRAAGFSLAREKIDDVSELEESQSLIKRLRELQGLRGEGASTSEEDNNSLVESISYADLDLLNIPDLLPAVNHSRQKALNIYRALSKINLMSVERKEKYLVTQFLLEHLSKPSRRVAERYILPSFETPNARVRYFPDISSVILLVLLNVGIGLVLSIPVEGKTILDRVGRDSFSVWLQIGVLALLVDLLVVKPFAVYLRRVVLVGYFKSELNTLAAVLQERSKIILMRSHGVIRNYLW